MYHYAEFYSRLIFNGNATPLDKKFYELIHLLKSNSMHIVLMYLNDKYEHNAFDETAFIEMIDALISLMCRAKICRQTSADTAQNAGNIIWRLEKADTVNTDKFWTAITSGNGKYVFPSDEDFNKALTSTELNLTFKDGCKYLLYSLEDRAYTNYNDTRVEFVMPRKFDSKWKNYLKSKNDFRAEQCVNSLGNLVLTDNDKNTKATFNDKRVGYATSRFGYTRDLAKYSDWTSRQIQRRAENLSKLALQIWHLPTEYKSAVESSNNTFTLDSDFDQFKRTKLSTFSFAGTEKSIYYWRDLLREIISELYKLDKDTFKQAVNDSNRSNCFATDSTKFQAPFALDNNYYLETHYCASDCLKIIKAIVESFDRISNTNFKDEIWFTLNSN